MQTDPIADFLTRIRNAAAAKHQRVDVPVSKLKTEIARILKEEGYISTFKLVDENKSRKQLRVFLKYTPDRRAPLFGLRGHSPGRWRSRHQHYDHAQGPDERPFRPQSENRR
jgi:ribosomal protein S8